MSGVTVKREPSESAEDCSNTKRQRDLFSNVNASVHDHSQGNINIVIGNNNSFHHGPTLTQSNKTAADSVQNLNRSHNAEYDMVAVTQRGPCSPGTRQAILDAQEHWCREATESLYWLSGMAGTGKTTIVYSLCEKLAELKILGASFFCSRSLPDCRDINLIIPTIAFQLAQRYPLFGEALGHALHEDAGILRRKLDVQLRELIIKPWGAKDGLPSNLVVVLDALDECDEGHSMFLQVLFNHAGMLPFKIMMTSRPEFSIRKVLLVRKERESHILSTFTLHEVEESMVKEDIMRYVESELKECISIFSPSDIARLVDQCGKLFIYAATLVRFIMDEDGDHFSRFQSLLTLSPSDIRDMAIQPIDVLYTQILGRVLSENKPRSEVEGIKLVLHTIVCAQEPLTRDEIAALLRLSVAEVDARLKSLHSLIFVPQGTGQSLATFHISFFDFMIDPSRSKSLCCQPHDFNLEFGKRCLALMDYGLRHKLHELIRCHPNGPIPLEVTLMHIPTELRYACIFIIEHWRLSHLPHSQVPISPIRHFLTNTLFYWFQCLSLIGKLPVASESLGALVELIWQDSDLVALVFDAQRWIHVYHAIISQPRIETFFSALVWIPESSPLRLHNDLFWRSAKLPQVLHGLDPNWTGPEQVINMHSDNIYSIAVSPNGRWVVSGSDDRTVRIWNVHSHAGESILEGHTDLVRSVAISGNGHRIVSGSDDGTIRVWNTVTRRPPLILNANGWILAVAISLDEKWISSGHTDNSVRIWDTRDGQTVHLLDGHSKYVRSVSFAIDNIHLVSASEDRTARVWNALTGVLICVLRGHLDSVWSVAWSPLGDRIITGSMDKTAKIWDTNGKEVLSLSGHSDSVSSVALTPDGKQAVTGSDDKTLRIWDTSTGDVIRVFAGLTKAVRSVAVFPDGFKIAGSSGGVVSIWSLRDQHPVGRGEGEANHSRPFPVLAKSVAFSSDGQRILLLPYLHILNTATLQPITTSRSKFSCGAISTSGERAAAARKEVIHIWELGGDVVSHLTADEHTNNVRSIAFSHDDYRLVSTSDDDTARIWCAVTGQQIQALYHLRSVFGASFSHDDTQVITAAGSTAHIWNVHTGEHLHQFGSDIMSAAFTPDGRHIITSSFSTAQIWDLDTRSILHMRAGYRHWTMMVDGSSYALSEDGQWICRSINLNDTPSRLLWIPLQYRPMLTDPYGIKPFASGPLFSWSSDGVQVCLPRHDSLITLMIPHVNSM